MSVVGWSPVKGVTDPTTTLHDACPLCDSQDIWVRVEDDEWTITCRTCGHTWTLTDTELAGLA